MCYKCFWVYRTAAMSTADTLCGKTTHSKVFLAQLIWNHRFIISPESCLRSDKHNVSGMFLDISTIHYALIALCTCGSVFAGRTLCPFCVIFFQKGNLKPPLCYLTGELLAFWHPNIASGMFLDIYALGLGEIGLVGQKLKVPRDSGRSAQIKKLGKNQL